MCKKKPIRKCSGCGERFEKDKLIRVVRIPTAEQSNEKDDKVVVDLMGKLQGRGAYVCKKSKCLKKAMKSNRFARTLHCPIPQKVFDELERSIQEIE